MTEPTPLRQKRALPNRCPDADYLESMAASMEKIAASLERIEPAADVIHDLADRLDRLCQFAKRKGPWILASMPVIITAINAVSPNAGAILKVIVAAIGSPG